MSPDLRLAVIIASTRPVRVGPAIARWFVERARAHGKFEVELVDLVTVALPLLDEPRHPRLHEYQHDHTRRWSATVGAADAFAFVTPEYNHGSPPALVNALDYLFTEWSYKPAAFVSYGGTSAATRSVAMTKEILTALKVVPLLESVAIAQFHEFLRDGDFVGNAIHLQAATAMLDELERWSRALQALRTRPAS